MIYIVSNIHRSGSSMMMRCLESGGLNPAYDKESNSMNESAPDDYIPNPNGFYQFVNEIGEGFIGYDGMVIKCPIRELATLPLHQYKVVLLKRNPAEIRASMGKWTPYESWGKDEVLTYLYNWYFDKVIARCTARGDMEITVLNYADIIANPIVEFTKLASWGIDVNAAASLVDETLYRLKLEVV